MKTFFLILTLASVALAAKKSRMHPNSARSNQAENQYLDCYDYPGQSGANVRITDYITNLGAIGFDNLASSCCLNGIWLLYDETDYNSRNLEVKNHSQRLSFQ